MVAFFLRKYIDMIQLFLFILGFLTLGLSFLTPTDATLWGGGYW